LTGKEIITEINDENHDCVGQKGTIIMAFSTVSDLILDKTKRWKNIWTHI
jgi:aminoglycoside N3'-acetyltransferase